MNVRETGRFAWQGVTANKTRSALTTLGILIGVAAVIILVAVGTGSSQAVQDSIGALGSNTLTVTAGAGGEGGPGGGGGFLGGAARSPGRSVRWRGHHDQPERHLDAGSRADHGGRRSDRHQRRGRPCARGRARGQRLVGHRDL